MIATIVAQQVMSLRRQRIFVALLAIFLVMTALAGVIGWSSHNTVDRAYNEAVRILTAAGKRAPSNPFALKPTLSLLSNMAIYIPLIGALLSVVLGHLSLADDQTNGFGRLIFSRPVSRTRYVFAKMLGAGAVIGVVLVASLVVSVLSLLAVNGSLPPTADIGRLVLFYGLGWLYLMLFALVGMVTVLMTRSRSLALLSALGTWLVVTFAVPQFTSGVRPVASLNPVNSPVSTSQAFFDFTSHGRPWSVSEQYKEASARILNTASAESTFETLKRILPIVVLLVALVVLAVVLVRRHDYSRSIASE